MRQVAELAERVVRDGALHAEAVSACAQYSGYAQLTLQALFASSPPTGERLYREVLADAGRLDSSTGEVLDRLETGWTGIWSIESAHSIGCVDLRDQITGERRRIWDRDLAAELNVGEALLARVVDLDGAPVLTAWGLDPLGSGMAELLAQLVRSELDATDEGDVDPDRLRRGGITFLMVLSVEKARQGVDGLHEMTERMSQSLLHQLSGDR